MESRLHTVGSCHERAPSKSCGSDAIVLILVLQFTWARAQLPHVQSRNNNNCPANFPDLQRGSNEIKYVNILENCGTLYKANVPPH